MALAKSIRNMRWQNKPSDVIQCCICGADRVRTNRQRQTKVKTCGSPHCRAMAAAVGVSVGKLTSARREDVRRWFKALRQPPLLLSPEERRHIVRIIHGEVCLADRRAVDRTRWRLTKAKVVVAA